VPTYYTALWTTTGEVNGAGYTRNSTSFDSTSNLEAITWGPLTVSWGTIVGIRIFDASGALLYMANLVQNVTTRAGYRYRISKGNIILTTAGSGAGFDMSMFDQALFDQLEAGNVLAPVELWELTIPPPAPTRFRVLDWARRPM